MQACTHEAQHNKQQDNRQQVLPLPNTCKPDRVGTQQKRRQVGGSNHHRS